MERRVGAVWGVAAALLVAGCGGGGDDRGAQGPDGDVEVVDLAGTTEQGLRMRLEVVGDRRERRVRLRLPTECPKEGEEDPRELDLTDEAIQADVAGDGSFRVEESYVEDGTDGDEQHVEYRIDGRYAGDGTASGSVEVRSRWWNGQSEEFSPWCETGSMGWEATGPPATRDQVEVPLAVPAGPGGLMLPHGDEVLVLNEAGDVLRVGPDGVARRLDGSPAPTPTTTTTVVGPGTGPQVIEVGPAVSPPLSLAGAAVVAEGVWVPRAGGAARRELAGGQETAHVTGQLVTTTSGHGALWTVSHAPWTGARTLERRDPVTGTVLASAPVLDGSLAAGPTDMWFAYATLAAKYLERIDPTTAATVERIEIDADSPTDTTLVVSADAAWMHSGEGLVRTDLATGDQEWLDLPTAPDAVAASATADGGVWTAHFREAVVRRLDAAGRVAETIDVADGYWSLATTGDGAVWLVGLYDRPRLVRLAAGVT